MKYFTPKVLLRLEGLFFLITACIFYTKLHFSWALFAIFFLLPDISMLGYLLNKQVGTICYNFIHTYFLPLSIFIILFYLKKSDNYWIPLAWIAHIGFDRLLGYGIKYETAFKDTHLQRV